MASQPHNKPRLPRLPLNPRTYLYASAFIKICLIGFALDVYIELLKSIGGKLP